jgi:dTDP-4-dehydrorhamnose reductase
MRSILFGKDGQVGQELQRVLLSFGDLIPLSRADCDLQDQDAINRILSQHSPNLIINAAAYTNVDEAERHENAACAYAVNAHAVGTMAEYAQRTGALLVHYSTDYVFDGRSATPYSEYDPTDPINVYGYSKLAGEKAIFETGCEALVFRTSWVYSRHGRNFLKTMLKLATERDTLKVVDDQHGAPTSAELIADVTALAISAYRSGSLAAGLYHLTASGETSWHGFARHIIDRAGKSGAALKLTADKVQAIPTEGYPTPARRPASSRLNIQKLAEGLRIQLPHWSLHADRTIDQLKNLEHHS